MQWHTETLAAQFGSNFQNPSALGGLPIPVQTRILLGHEFSPSPFDSKSLLKEEKNGPYTIFLTATATAKITGMIGTQCFCTCPLGATTIPAAATTILRASSSSTVSLGASLSSSSSQSQTLSSSPSSSTEGGASSSAQYLSSSTSTLAEASSAAQSSS